MAGDPPNISSPTPADGGAPANPGPVVAPPISATPTGDSQQWSVVAWYSKPSIHLRPSTLKVYDPKVSNLFPNPSILFDITLKKKTDKTTIEIRDGGTVIRSQEFTSGVMIEPGDHTWVWDGYSDDNRLDTPMLRRTKMTAYVRTDAGEDKADFKCDDSSDNAWADVRVYLDSKSIDILAFVNIAPSPALGKRPTDAELATAKTQIKTGIHRYWSRDSSQSTKRKITIDGVDYNVTATALDDASKGVSYTVESGGYFNDRSCNYGVVVPGGTIAFSVPGSSNEDQEHTGAHEFGHSVLRDANGFDYSLTHKGSSTRTQQPVAGNFLPSAPDEVDLMKYYAGLAFAGDTDVRWAHYDADAYSRCNAVEEDVKALIACVRLKFIAS